ncbi:hypothetical protein SMD44_08669 [Streptomyces alboflavus]|uniref:Uncharacterized protein n=1 Tax=Streptomyces alboflavus TaxID=67267 RepID=A0A1Z1WS87_9ACTN|nr:hypothetical protein SMD44_08669 [Streptomyces alboflavus]
MAGNRKMLGLSSHRSALTSRSVKFPLASVRTVPRFRVSRSVGSMGSPHGFQVS